MLVQKSVKFCSFTRVVGTYLATSPGTGEFQTNADGISCTAWLGAGVFESARSSIRSARSSPSSFVIYTRAVRSVIPSRLWQPLAVARFLLPPKSSGTLCLSMSTHHRLLQPFANGWRHSSSNSHFRTSCTGRLSPLKPLTLILTVIVDFAMAYVVLCVTEGCEGRKVKGSKVLPASL